MAISGVTIVLVSVLYYTTELNNLFTNMNSIESEITSIELEVNFIKADKDILDQRLTDIRKSLPDSLFKDTISDYLHVENLKDRLLNDKNFRDYFEFLCKYENKINPYRSKVDIVKSETELLFKLNREIERKLTQLKIKAKTLKSENGKLLFNSFILIILSFVGYKMARYGFKEWYYKVQKPSEEKLALELKELRNKHNME
jgi:uncharacterized protein (DUF1499 family)